MEVILNQNSKISFKTFLKQIMFVFVICFSNFKAQDSTTIRFGFVSDTQQPIWIEKIFLKANHNLKATNAIFSSLSNNEGISSLFHLGDITAIGMFNGEWEEMDQNFSRLRKKNIPIYPAMGNHDYYIFKSYALEQFRKRFPSVKRTWYVVKLNSVAVLILNSNFSRLSDSEIEEQKKWYSNTVEELEKNDSINTIIVGVHHSPFTNSKVIDPSEDVQNNFVPQFLKSKKGKLFISGHAHTFEHFKRNGKDFLVIGGGGGLQHPLLTGNSQLWKDLFPIPTSVRMFHYLVCEATETQLRLKVMMLNQDFKTFFLADELNLELSN